MSTSRSTSRGRIGRATRGAALTAGLVLALLAAGPAAAITDEEVFRTFRFNFVNPGGRALAMGGSFIAVADDATAAAANPAGLTNLIAPELFTELRLHAPAEIRIEGLVDDPAGGPGQVLTTATADPDNVIHPSFISFVKPFDKWVLGLSRQEILRTRSDVTNDMLESMIAGGESRARAIGSIDMLIESYNVSAAFTAGSWFAAGFTVGWSRIDVESRVENFFDYDFDPTWPVDGLVPDYATAIDDTDSDLTFGVGLLFKPLEKLSIGLVYRDGPEFDLVETIEDTRLMIAPGTQCPPFGPCQTTTFPSAPILADFVGNRNASSLSPLGFLANPAMFDDPMSFTTGFSVPDQYGIGIGIRPTPSFTISIDAVQVQYSDLADDFVGNVSALTFPGDGLDCDPSKPQADGSFPCDYLTPVARYRFEDETIFRLGMEYVWLLNEKTPFALRWGGYTDPNVRLSADFGPGGVFIADDATYPEGDEEIHLTVGFGFVLQDKFQADFAADFSELGDTYLASFIYHF